MYIFPDCLLTPVQMLLMTVLQQYLPNNCLTIIADTHLDLIVPKSAIRISPGKDLVERLVNATEMGCLDYVVQMNNPKQFMLAFEEVTHVANVRKSNKKIILVFDGFSNSSEDDLLSILPMKETSFIPNILLIYPSENDIDNFDIVTHKYVGENEKRHEPVVLDQWISHNRTFVKNANLFPHDMSNFYGKTVKVSCFVYKPYVLLDLDRTVTPSGQDGIEIRILEEFCKWINCSIEVVREGEDQWGEIYENRTGTGVLGSVVQDKSDFGIAAFYPWFEESVFLDFSASCVKTSVTVITPAPLLLSNWRTPFLPFSTHMWGAILATFVLSAGALAVAQGFTAHKIFFTTFGILINQSQILKESWRIRIVTIWLLLMGLVIDNAYSGGLASTFTVPTYEPSYNTIQDIVNRKLEWGATSDAWLYSLLPSEDAYPFDDLQRKSYTRSLAFSIEKLPGGYFAVGEYVPEDAIAGLQLLQEDFYFEYTVICMRKSSAFTEKLGVLIGRLHQSGLLLAWVKQVSLKYLNYKVQSGVRLSRSKRDVETLRPLNLQQFMGIYIIYGVGVVISIIIFLMELLCSCHRTSEESSEE